MPNEKECIMSRLFLATLLCVFGNCPYHAPNRSGTSFSSSSAAARIADASMLNRQVDEAMTHEDVSAMIRTFLSTDSNAQIAWVRESRKLLDRRRVTFDRERAVFHWGPWQVHPAQAKVLLTSDRGQLIGRIEKTDNRYLITDVHVYEFRR
jgi:hypothetical protein